MALELDQIQGVVLSSYSHLPVSQYLFLKIEDVAKAKTWLSQLTGQITASTPWPREAYYDEQLKRERHRTVKPSTCLNIAFTSEGLELLLGKNSTESFSSEFRDAFRQGPHLDTRLARLGDIGNNHPDKWEYGGPTQEPIHILLLLFAKNATELANLRNSLVGQPEQQGLKVVATEETYRPAHGREPFGFRDGLSQPWVEGSEAILHKKPAENQPIVKAGEFILGHENEYGLKPPAPSQPELATNGTYLVYRKLVQNVAGFWNFMFEQSQQDQQKADWLAAKFVGRWRSGMPLTLAPHQDTLPKGQQPPTDFLFMETDTAGYGCPVGSHIRRSNPRDSLQPAPEASLKAVNKHRIIRRARVFGSHYPEDVVQHLLETKQRHNAPQFVNEDEKPKGLALLAVNTDIKRQFEFIQQTWLVDPKFNGLYEDKDPIVGTNNGKDRLDLQEAKDGIKDSPRGTTLTIPQLPVRRQVKDIPQFVAVRASAYFFLPSMKGLNYIAR